MSHVSRLERIAGDTSSHEGPLRRVASLPPPGPTAVLGLRIVPTFRDMFADFGAALPLATPVVSNPACGLGMALAFTVALVSAALVPMRPIRCAAMLGALLVAHVAAFGVTVYSMYLPIFEMAGNIR